MNCPVCDGTLREIDKHGVTVDICPGCKGVWLDRGELDKVLEMAASGGPGGLGDRDSRTERDVSERERRSRTDDDDEYEDRYPGGHARGSERSSPKRRGSWLSDIFESFGGD